MCKSQPMDDNRQTVPDRDVVRSRDPLTFLGLQSYHWSGWTYINSNNRMTYYPQEAWLGHATHWKIDTRATGQEACDCVNITLFAVMQCIAQFVSNILRYLFYFRSGWRQTSSLVDRLIVASASPGWQTIQERVVVRPCEPFEVWWAPTISLQRLSCQIVYTGRLFSGKLVVSMIQSDVDRIEAFRLTLGFFDDVSMAL